MDYYKNIVPQFGRIGQPMTREAQICAEEFAERITLQLEGDEAVQHFNTWMQEHDLPFRAEERPQIWYDMSGARSMTY